MRRLTGRVIAMMVESDVPLSLKLGNGKRKRGKPAFFVNVLHADRQLFRYRLGSKERQIVINQTHFCAHISWWAEIPSSLRAIV